MKLSGLEAIRAKERRKRKQLGSIAGQAKQARGYKPGEGSKMAERLRQRGQ